MVRWAGIRVRVGAGRGRTGRLAQTLLARAQVLLVCRGTELFDVMPRRSFTSYLRDWLCAAAVTFSAIAAPSFASTGQV